MTETPPPDALEPGDIQYPYVDPVWHDGDIVAPPAPDYVPPFDPDAVPPEPEPEPEPPPE